MAFLTRHLLESTLFCLLLSGLACCVRKGAGARYAVWLIGIAKFAVPSVLLAATGARLALFWPATSWLSAVANRVSAALIAVLGILPASVQTPGSTTYLTILLVWILGIAVMLGVWFAKLHIGGYRLALPTSEEQKVLDRMTSLIRLRTPVQLRVSESPVGPALRGLWRFTLIVPKGLSISLTRPEFEAVLLHELAHARRLDNLVAAFVHTLVCVFWFHPLLWLAERQLNVEREHACDEFVIACGTSPQTYAEGIVKVCKFHLVVAPAGVSAMTGSDLKQRLDLILNSHYSLPLRYVPRILIAGLTLLMPVFPIAGGYCQQCVSSDERPAVIQLRP